MSWFEMAPKSAVPQKRCLDQVEHLFCLGIDSHHTYSTWTPALFCGLHCRIKNNAKKKIAKKQKYQAGQKCLVPEPKAAWQGEDSEGFWKGIIRKYHFSFFVS
jgi:hypothetical protein